jgi:hypothetical protein
MVVKVLAFKGEQAHRGFVHEVMKNTIQVRFHNRCSMSGRWTIRFELNRTMFRRRHRALDQCETVLPRIISEHPNFQAELTLSEDAIARSVSWRNGDMNEEQKLAVQSVLARSSPGAPPFILFGYVTHLQSTNAGLSLVVRCYRPPGTGKTTTVVEMICQVCPTNVSARTSIEFFIAPIDCCPAAQCQGLSVRSQQRSHGLVACSSS